MTETIGRVEFDDVIRHVTTKADRAQSQAAAAMEEAKHCSLALEVAEWQLLRLQRLVISLLPREQQEALGVEVRAGVREGPPVDVVEREADDGHEWRERLRRTARERGIDLDQVRGFSPWVNGPIVRQSAPKTDGAPTVSNMTVEESRDWLKRLDAITDDTARHNEGGAVSEDTAAITAALSDCAPIGEATVRAVKDLGAFFQVDPERDGPCYNR